MIDAAYTAPSEEELEVAMKTIEQKEGVSPFHFYTESPLDTKFSPENAEHCRPVRREQGPCAHGSRTLVRTALIPCAQRLEPILEPFVDSRFLKDAAYHSQTAQSIANVVFSRNSFRVSLGNIS